MSNHWDLLWSFKRSILHTPFCHKVATRHNINDTRTRQIDNSTNNIGSDRRQKTSTVFFVQLFNRQKIDEFRSEDVNLKSEQDETVSNRSKEFSTFGHQMPSAQISRAGIGNQRCRFLCSVWRSYFAFYFSLSTPGLEYTSNIFATTTMLLVCMTFAVIFFQKHQLFNSIDEFERNFYR